MVARPTLRLVIGLVCVLIVIVVATVTLTITYSVSLNTIRDVGKQYSASLATNARDRTEAYFKQPSTHLDVLGDMIAGGEFDLPSAIPDQTLVQPKERMLDLFWQQSRSVNHDYSVAGVMYEDGSGCFAYDIENQSYIHGWCRYTQDWPRSGNQSILLKNWFYGNGSVAPNHFYNNSYNYDSRIPAYYTAQLLIGGISRGLWFPISLTFASELYRFVWPAAKPLFNSTNGFIGMATLTIRLETISSYLENVRGTPNTQAFAVQEDGFLIASTHSAQMVTYTRVSPSTPLGQGCASSADATAASAEVVLVMGCRASARTFSAYPPLVKASEDRGFLHTASTEVKIIDVDGEAYFVASAGVTNEYRYFGLNIVLCMPEADVLGDIVAGRNLAIGVTVAVAVVSAAIAFALLYFLLQPLADVSDRMQATARLKEQTDAGKLSAMAEIRTLQKAYSEMNTAIRSFTRYVPRDVVKDLMESGELCKISMTPTQCTMLFVDIAGFTTVCERVPPDVLSDLVSEYFDIASRIVMRYEGLIDKFIGDCIMAVWGAPFGSANQEVKATLTALMLDRETLVAPLAPAWDEAGELLRVRVGVSSGEVLAGNMGSNERMSYTVIGDAVNLAARLESMNKQFDTRVMVSEMVAAELGGVFVLRLLMPIAVVGKDRPVRVFEVMGLAGTLSQEDATRLELNDRGAADDNNLNSDSQESLNAPLATPGSQSLQSSHSQRRRMKRRTALTTAQLVQDAAVRTASTDVPAVAIPDDIAFAKAHTDLVLAYIAGDFARAVSLAERVASMPAVSEPGPWSRRPERSVHLVRDLSEQYLKEGTPTGFDGVFKALDK